MRVTFSEEAELVKSSAPIGVADFLSSINATLARQYARIEGEVTSVKDSYATAIYFTIKDTTRDALLNCVIWRTTYNQNGVRLKEGDTVIVSGVPEIYAARGTFSLKVSTIEYAGEGQLKRAYDELRAKLTAEGLLDPLRKRSLPEYPTRVGVITSRSGVVIQDFSANLGRYGFRVTLVDSRVEGKDAIHELLAALKKMAKADIEILVIMRGGGSWESLQAFNTESVVRAIAAFPQPVLTGIGHDVDVTLAELVADFGSSTPTAVAEKLNETWDELALSLAAAETKIVNAFERTLLRLDRGIAATHTRIPRRFEQMLARERETLSSHAQSTRQTFATLRDRVLSLSGAVALATAGMKTVLAKQASELANRGQIIRGYLARAIDTSTESLRTQGKQLVTEHSYRLRQAKTELATLEKTVRVSDPAHNLRLGYSLSYAGGRLVRTRADVTPGTIITTEVADGRFTAEVTEVE